MGIKMKKTERSVCDIEMILNSMRTNTTRAEKWNWAHTNKIRLQIERSCCPRSRTSYEILQKSIRAGIPFVAAVGAPSSLAVELANVFNVTLLGFLSEQRFNVYSAPERVLAITS